MRKTTLGTVRPFFCTVMLILFLLAGCDGDEPAFKVDLSVRETPRVQQDVDGLTYAYLPQYSHSVSYQKHRRLVDYLRAKTGLNVRQIFPDNFGEHMKMAGEGKIDLSFTNPYFYVRMADSVWFGGFCPDCRKARRGPLSRAGNLPGGQSSDPNLG